MINKAMKQNTSRDNHSQQQLLIDHLWKYEGCSICFGRGGLFIQNLKFLSISHIQMHLLSTFRNSISLWRLICIPHGFI